MSNLRIIRKLVWSSLHGEESRDELWERNSGGEGYCLLFFSCRILISFMEDEWFFLVFLLMLEFSKKKRHFRHFYIFEADFSTIS